MKLHFPWNGVEKILEEVRTATTANPLYGEETGKGLWLVGDQGVYLMPNTTDGIHSKNRQKDEPLLVVYAQECDPTKLEFDTWWENKRASFGSDDGVEFFDLPSIEKLAADPPQPNAKPHHLVAEISPKRIAIGVVWRTGVRSRKRA